MAEKEFIEREKVLLQIDLHGTNKFGMLDEDIREFIKKQPAADVVKVKHGEWRKREVIIFDDELVGYNCSECNTTWDTGTNYCPNCGAKMDGKGD